MRPLGVFQVLPSSPSAPQALPRVRTSLAECVEPAVFSCLQLWHGCPYPTSQPPEQAAGLDRRSILCSLSPFPTSALPIFLQKFASTDLWQVSRWVLNMKR